MWWHTFFLFDVVASAVVVRISENVPLLANNCQNSRSKLEDFFSSASVQILAATNTVLDDVVIELPAAWGYCGGNVPEKKLPNKAVNVLIDANKPTKAIQHQGCGRSGHMIFLNGSDLLTSSNSPGLEFSVEWIKYKFGLFDEFGAQGDAMYPLFYREANTVVPNACTNSPIRGNFSQSCVENCLDLEQTHIESSLLFSKANAFFPKISKLCNQTTHNKLAPTKQNLICKGKSAMEIIAALQISSHIPRRRMYEQLPSFTYFQPKAQSVGLIIILDNGPQMEAYWPVLRVGIEQLMLVLPGDTLLASVIGSQVTGPRVVDNGNNDRYWESVIFGPTLHIESPLSIKSALSSVKNLLLSVVKSPHILILTATDSVVEDLAAELSFIAENRIQVDILTFGGLNNPQIIGLAKYGGFFSVPNITDTVTRAAYAGSVLRQVGSQALQRNSQDVIMIGNQLTYARGVAGNFSLPNIGGLSPDDKFNMSLTFVGPWTSVPTITAFSPSGIKYGSKLGDNVIAQKWSQQVMELKGPYEAGMWNYTLNNAARSDIGKTVFIVGHLNVKNEAVVQGFLDQVAVAGSVKGNETKAVTAFGFVNNHELERGHDYSGSIKCHLWLPDSEEHDIDLLDNGLIYPDITRGDGIFSQYIVPLISNGYHSSLCELKSSDGSIQRHFPMPSFHVIDHDSPFNDTIPPSRITDLQVNIKAADPYGAASLNFTWTAPGDDFNSGKALYYRVYCGFSRDQLSYHDCNAITQTVMYARAPGSQELLREPSYREFDRELFVSVRTSDGVNEAEFSNIVSIFVESPTTTSSSTTSTSTTPTTSTFYTSETSTLTSSTLDTLSTSQKSTKDASNETFIPAEYPENEDDGLVISKTALIAIVSSLSVMLFLIILLLAISICLKMYRKREESELLKERMKRSLEPNPFDHPQPPQPAPLPPREFYEPYNNMAAKHADDYAYRVTQIVPESPRESRIHKVNRQGRRTSGKTKKRSRRSSRRTVSDLSSDSGTEMDFRHQTRSGLPNQAFVHSRTPSSSLRYNELNVRNLGHDTVGIPLAPPVDHLYARPLPRHSRPEIVVAGQGSFGKKPFQRGHLRQSSHISTSSAGTFQPVDPKKPWNGRSTTIVNVDTHQRQEWTTDTEDQDLESVRVKKNQPAFFQNRVSSNPDLARSNAPFNYITFSQQLYGEKSDHASANHLERPNKRAISYV